MAVDQQLESEKLARDAQEKTLEKIFLVERTAREAQERMIQEQFSQEIGTLEKQLESVRELVSQDVAAREKHFENYKESLQREIRAREVGERELHESLTKERAKHEQLHAAVQSLSQWQQDARQLMDNIAHVSAEYGKHYETINEHVQYMQRNLTEVDSLVLKETEERSKENKRIWDAIDTHTHDLSTQVMPVEVLDKKGSLEETEPIDSYLPFPCQPLTSFLRLGGQGLDSSVNRRPLRFGEGRA